MLVQNVRAPGAVQADVDALIKRFTQPPRPSSAREHADLLLTLIEDSSLPAIAGSDGRTVRTAAVQALLALGFPYALEVPPEALTALHATEHGASRSRPLGPKGREGFGIIMAIGLLPLVDAFLLASVLMVACAAGLTYLPAYLTLLGHTRRSRILKGLGTIWLIISALILLKEGFSVLDLHVFASVVLALMAGGILYGTWLMNSERGTGTTQ